MPEDFIVADKFAEDANHSIKDENEGVPDGWLGLDIGPKTIAKNNDIIARSKTIFWNGP